MVAVLGLSESSRADLNAQIEELGTNLLTVEPATGFGAGDGSLPEEAVAKLGRIGPVEVVADVDRRSTNLPLRNDVMSDNETKGLTAVAADVDLIGDASRHRAHRVVARRDHVDRPRRSCSARSPRIAWRSTAATSPTVR